MTELFISDTRPRVQYIYDPDSHSSQQFDFAFTILDPTDLKVAVDGDMLEPSEFEIEGAGEAGGGVVTVTRPLTARARVTLWRDMPFTRATDFASGADLRATVLNAELDRIVMLLQQAEALVGDAIRRPPHDTAGALLLPPVTDRAGRYLSFDAAGFPEAAEPRLPPSLADFALIYAGPHASADAPTVRVNGAALLPGDLYYATDLAALMVWDGSAWTHPDVISGDYLETDGSVAMTADLNMNGHALSQVSTLNGRDVTADGAALDNIVAHGDPVARDMTLVNAWEIARIDGLSTRGMLNTYLDIFTDESGVSHDTEGAVARSEGTAIGDMTDGGGLAAAFDGNNDQAFGSVSSAAGATESYVGKDWGSGIARKISRVQTWGASDNGYSGSGANYTLKLWGSNTAPTAWNDGTEIGAIATNQSDANNADPKDASFDISKQTAYRYHWVSVENLSATPCYMAEVIFTEGIEGDSVNATYDAAGDYYTSRSMVADNPGNADRSVLSFRAASGGAYGYIGAEFAAPTGSTALLEFILYPNSLSLATGGVQAVLRDTSNNVIATSDTQSGASITDPITFTFSGASVTPGTTYRVTIDNTGAGAGGNIQTVSTADGYGTGRSGSLGSLTFGDFTGGEDMRFETVFFGAVEDMTLVSKTITAAAPPASLRPLVDVEAIDDATENTDFTLDVSRDGGTTWGAATLAPISGGNAARAVYAATVDVSGQPSGTDVVYRFKTLNGKEIRLHRVGLQADVGLSVQ